MSRLYYQLTSWVVATFLFLSFTSCGKDEQKEEMHYIKIGTGSQVGVYYTAGLGIAEYINNQGGKVAIDASVDATDGSVFNINAVVYGALDFGFAQIDRQYQAYYGTGAWAGNPQKKLRFVCSLYPEVITVVASQKSGIKTIGDLKGKVISVGSHGSGSRGNAVDTLSAVGLQENRDYVAENLKASEASMMLQDGRIDAFFYTVGHPNGLITEATNGKRKVSIIPIDGLGRLVEKSPFYTHETIPASYYPEATAGEDVASLGLLTTIVTSSDVSDEVVYNLMKALFGNLEDFKGRHPSFENLNPERMGSGAFAPVHPGAKKFYKEAGILFVP